MKRAYRKSQYAKPCEQYCRETYPEEANAIFQKAEEYYLNFLKDMPDLGEKHDGEEYAGLVHDPCLL